MTWYLILSWVFKAFGFASAAESMLHKHEAKVKAQHEADVPVTDQEWTDKADKGDL